MPLIVFDPDYNNNRCSNIPKFKGGGLSGAKRCEYMDLCNQITSRDTTLDYVSIRDRILEIMREDVIQYIHTLPDEDQPSLLNDIDSFYSSFDQSDTPFNCINIIGLQTAILFTNYIISKGESPKPITIMYKIYNDFKDKIVNSELYNNPNNIFKRTRHKYFEYYRYKNYISDNDPTKGIPDTTPILMIFIGGLSIQELMKSYFNNVFFLWLSYKKEYIDDTTDDGDTYPVDIIHHDGGHYKNFLKCYRYPIMFSEIKNFYNYASSIQDKSIRYAIMLTFFIILHENICNSFSMIVSNNKTGNTLNNKFFNNINEEFIYKELEDYLFSFKTVRSIGTAIPKQYREFVEGSEIYLNEDKIKEYLHKVSKIYVKYYREYLTTKNAQLGGKKTRKRSTRKRRAKN